MIRDTLHELSLRRLLHSGIENARLGEGLTFQQIGDRIIVNLRCGSVWARLDSRPGVEPMFEIMVDETPAVSDHDRLLLNEILSRVTG